MNCSVVAIRNHSTAGHGCLEVYFRLGSTLLMNVGKNKEDFSYLVYYLVLLHMF